MNQLIQYQGEFQYVYNEIYRMSQGEFARCAYAITVDEIMALPDGLANSMKKFQAHNNVPVFLKGGPADKVLFGLTVGLCGLGIVSMLEMIYTLGFKKKSS